MMISSLVAANDDAASLDLLDTAAANGSFKVLGRAIDAAGLADALRGPGPFTLLAPTDAAFEALPPGALDRLFDPAHRDELAALLKYHVLRGRRSSTDIGRWKAASTVHGQSVPVQLRDGRLTVDGALFTTADISSTNGTIHAIDRVNIPRPTDN